MKGVHLVAIAGLAGLIACQDRAEVKNLGEVQSAGKVPSGATGGVIRGTIDVAPEFKASLKSTDVLYVFARAGDSGPPVAVKRYLPGEFSFPLSYDLSAADMMIRQPGLVFTGEMKVFARISRSGDAMGAPGDLEGYYPGGMVAPPASSVDFSIATERM